MLKGKIGDHKYLLDEWVYKKNILVKPSSISVWSKQKYWWKCKNGHEWETRVCTRASGSNCPYCTNRKVCNDNCLETKYPNIAKEWDYIKNSPITPTNITSGAGKKYWWKCSNNHSYQSSPNSRTTHNTRCPYCSNKRVADENCLATTHPTISSEWNIKRNKKSPKDVTYGSSQKVWWICKLKHEWETTIASRASKANSTGCPYCSGRYPTDNNRLSIKYPELCKEWNHVKNLRTPDQYSYGSDKKVWWICSKKHEWLSSISNRTCNNRMCPYCCNQKVLPENSFAKLNPILLNEWDWEENANIVPYNVAPHSNISVGWVCKNKHKWKTSTSNRTIGTQCPICITHGYSRSSIQWLDYISKTQNIFIQHKINLGEYVIKLTNGKKTKVDGYCKETNTVYEYDGCFYHGHPSHLCTKQRNSNDLNPKTHKIYSQLYTDTLDRHAQIINSKYNLVTIFGCEWNKRKKILNQIKKYKICNLTNIV